MDKKKIEEMVNYVFNQPEPKERKVVAITGCSTYGWIYYDNFCGNPECKNCTDRNEMIVKAFKEEVEKQIKELKNE